MADSQKSFWVGVALVVVIGLAGATLWEVANPSSDVAQQLAAINSRIDATNAALEKVRTASSSTGIDSQIAEIDAKIAKINAALATLPKGTELTGIADKIEKTNAALAALQKDTQIKSVAEKLDALNAGIKSADAALAKITKESTQGDLGAKVDAVGNKIDALGADLKNVDGSLAAIKQAIPAQNLTTQLAAIGDQIKSLNDHVAALQKTSAGADQTAALSSAVDALKKDVDAASALGAKLTDQVGKLQQATKTAAEPKPSELVFVYLHLPEESQLPKTVATVSPLIVEFERIGSTSDKGKAQAIIAKLKDIIKGRKDCTISVVGYADTLGSDNVNLQISKKRASVIAKQLAAAFAGTGVQINQAAWGERRLKDWTPDNTPNLANRRVDISVNCKG